MVFSIYVVLYGVQNVPIPRQCRSKPGPDYTLLQHTFPLPGNTLSGMYWLIPKARFIVVHFLWTMGSVRVVRADVLRPVWPRHVCLRIQYSYSISLAMLQKMFGAVP